MSDSQNILIQLDFNDSALDGMLIDERKTSEGFQADVLHELHEFINDQAGKIGACLMTIKGPYIRVTTMMRAVRYDESLQNACTMKELELAQKKDWANVNIVLIPNAGPEGMEQFHQAVASTD